MKAFVRLRNLGITDIHLGTNKVETFKEYTDVYTINQNMFCIWAMIFLIIM
jgi:hypothetical protein